MCCCCPPAISALFCLWVQSGFSKGSVAGALTFFPPEPALYKFERCDQDGNPLLDNEDGETNPDESHPDTSDGELGEVTVNTGHVEPLERKSPVKGKNETPSPVQQLTERSKKLRQRAKERYARDTSDLAAGVTFQLSLDPRLANPPVRGGTIEARKLPSKGSHVATLIYHLPQEYVTNRTKTIIYSHGNATDIGAMFMLQSVLVHSLLCNVVMYDYSGYGESGGVPTEGNSYNDVKTVYEFVKSGLAPDPSNIVLYGQSVGSGPSCALAYKKNELGGVILHSPFTSGMRVLTPSRALACLDIYPNIHRISHVRCPVMVIHGKLDEDVSFSHGYEMHQAVPEEFRRDPWWVPDRGHNDITDGPGKMTEYIRRLRTFLAGLDEE